MPTFNNLKDMEKYINAQAKQSMIKGNNVKNVVMNEGRKQVQEVVYDAYEPKVYQRTGSLKESWDTEETIDGIAIYNTRKDGDKDVASVVETGKGYDYTGNYAYERPRPFIASTRKALDGSSKLNEALRQDLKNIGLDVE